MSSSEYADEGTTAHALAAMCLKEGADAAAYIGRVIDSEDYEHAGLSPSGAHRWMPCPGSYAMEAGAREFTPRKFSMAVTAEMAEFVQVYIDNVRVYRDNGGVPGVMLVEQQLPISHLTEEEGATGSGDVVILLPGELQLHDLKFGRGVEVSPEDNEQELMYASGALVEFGDLIEDITDDFRIRLVIHQPRITAAPKEWDTTVKHLREFEALVRERASTARIAKRHAVNWMGKDDAYLEPGEEQCRFCEAKPVCPALAKFVERSVGAEFEVLVQAQSDPVAEEQVADDIAPPTDLKLLGQKLASVGLVEMWCKAVRGKVEGALFEHGNSADAVQALQFKLVQGKRGARAWADLSEAEKTLKSMRLKQEEMYDFSLISPTAAEKLLKDQPKRWKRVEPLITQSEGKPSVAPLDDKRAPLVLAKVADDFADLTQAEECLDLA